MAAKDMNGLQTLNHSKITSAMMLLRQVEENSAYARQPGTISGGFE